MIGTEFCDNGASGAITAHSEDPEQTVEEPYGAGGKEPIVVEVIAKFQDGVVPAADDDEDGEEDMQDEEGLVDKAAEVDVAEDQHGAGEDGGDDAPAPVGLLGLGRIVAQTLVHQQQGNAVENSLDGEDAGDPAVQENVSRVWPVGDPEEKIVAAGKENQEGKQAVGDVAGALAYVEEGFLSAGKPPWMGLRVGIVDGA